MIEATTILQVLLFPMIGLLWHGITRRIDRLEVKVDRLPAAEVCQAKYDAADQRISRLEGKLNGR